MLEPQYQEQLINEYIPLESLLQKHALTFPEAEERAMAFCEDFHRFANEHHIRTNNLLCTCLDFLNLPEAVRSDDLRFLYLAILTDCGLLFRMIQTAHGNRTSAAIWNSRRRWRNFPNGLIRKKR